MIIIYIHILLHVKLKLFPYKYCLSLFLLRFAHYIIDLFIFKIKTFLYYIEKLVTINSRKYWDELGCNIK